MLIVGFLFNSCRNPAYNIDVTVDANIMNYKATLLVSDVNGAVPAGLTVSVTGQDAAKVYDFSATKAIYAPGGIVTLGIPYMYTPEANKPLVFNMLFKAPGYMDKLIPMEIQLGQWTQTVLVTMTKPDQNTVAAAFKEQNTVLSATGATTAPVTVATTSNVNVTQTTTITIPAGTQFKDASGATLTGTLASTAITYDTADPRSLGLFPGGDMSAPVVTLPSGAGSAFFFPAGFTTILMEVGGKQVKTFANNPVTVKIQIDPTYKIVATSALVKAGDQLAIYSYEVATGVMKFESNQTVIADGPGKLAVQFTTTHLTDYVATEAKETTTCKDVKVTASASWLTDGASRPVTVQLFRANGTVLIGSSALTLSDGLVSTLGLLPEVPVQYKVIDITGEQLAEGTILNPCAGEPLNVVIRKPTGVIDAVRLTLNVYCPNKGKIMVPNFDMFFKLPGETTYKLLGTFSKGVLTTSALKVGTTYDFKAVWGNQVKLGMSRTITDADMAKTVGDGYYGDTVEPNRGFLVEACNGI